MMARVLIAIAAVALLLISFIQGLVTTDPPPGFALRWVDLAMIFPITGLGLTLCLCMSYVLNAVSTTNAKARWKIGRRFLWLCGMCIVFGIGALTSSAGMLLRHGIHASEVMLQYAAMYAALGGGMLCGATCSYFVARLLKWPILTSDRPADTEPGEELPASGWRAFLASPPLKRLLVLYSVVGLILVFCIGFVFWQIPKTMVESAEYEYTRKEVLEDERVLTHCGEILEVEFLPFESSYTSGWSDGVERREGEYRYKVDGREADCIVSVSWTTFGAGFGFQVKKVEIMRVGEGGEP